MNIKHLSAFLAVSFCALLSSSAFAHEQYHHGCEYSSGKAHDAYFEKHMSRLHSALKLSAAQEVGWTEFSGKMKPVEMERHAHKDWANLSTPDRLDQMLDGMKLHEKSMAEHVAAVRTFYESLTADQKKTFDSEFMGRGYMEHHSMRHDHDMQHTK